MSLDAYECDSLLIRKMGYEIDREAKCLLQLFSAAVVRSGMSEL